ncbi:MAG: hypothetical protein HYV39_03315 [Candidatus Levybacteria bacterium]|nr:hypothetical protein [Candidatus Levybacteria bacterium]
MQKQTNQEKILKDYEEKADALLKQMYQVLLRAQRKVEDNAYRKALLKL